MAMRYPSLSANILDAVGDTPLLELDGVFAKCEFLNPSGSIKARIAKYIIERAEETGAIKPGDTIVEATSGNTGNAFSRVAAVKGYRMIVVMPEGLSSERVAISRAYGAEVLFCGPSSGAHMIAARRIREQFPELKTVVTILDDEGEKYLHDFFMHPAPGADAPVPFH